MPRKNRKGSKMSILRSPNKNFSVINNICLRDPNLSARAKGLFAYVMTLPEGWSLNRTEIQKHFTEGRDAISTAFKELESHGYIKKTPRRAEGLLDGWDYTFIEDPSHCDPVILKTSNTDNPQLLITEDEVNTVCIKENYPKEDDSLFNLELQPMATDNEKAEELYAIYPRKIGKASAIRAIKKALKKVPYDELLGATEEFALSQEGRPEKNFIPHPATWFNQERWTDDREEWKSWKRKAYGLPPTGSEHYERHAQEVKERLQDNSNRGIVIEVPGGKE